ncbi:hypothetical protein BJY04DRAFT_232067 [Aspergillus karnatakaensis]|uniref:forkhead box transcription factor n=1 Tax=Aspergillus karnatakaensis TaxID=1810916 RepID=UPI003CCCCBB6
MDNRQELAAGVRRPPPVPDTGSIPVNQAAVDTSSKPIVARDPASGGKLQSSSSSRSPETPPSVFDGVYGNSPPENWSDSSSSSPEAMMPYQQPWVIEPAMNYSLIPSQSSIESLPDGLPRIIPCADGGSSEWSSNMMTSSYSPSRQLKPETRRLPAGKSDWVHGKSSEQPLYKSSHPVGALPPHSQAAYSSTNPPSTTSLSPTSAGIPYHSLPLSVVSPPVKLEMERDETGAANSDDAEDTNADPPYSQLIYEALFTAPGKKLPLQGIYHWFEKNTAKGKDRGSKGWQNSIRHNLSMNAGFEAVREESTPGKKAVNYWRLTDEAVNNGIQSTTRYRKQANYKKSAASDPPAPQRQRSGAKGGKATKITSRFRTTGLSLNSLSQEEYRRERAYRQHQHYQQQQQNHHHHHTQRVMPSQRHHHHLPPTTKNYLYSHHSGTPYLHHRPSPTTTAGSASGAGSGTTMPMTVMTRAPIEPFTLSHAHAHTHGAPCTTGPTVPSASLFCDMGGPSPDYMVLDTTGFMGLDGCGAGIHSSFGVGGPGIETTDLAVGL